MTTEVTCSLDNNAAAGESSKSVIDVLVMRGFSREAAEDLCASNPPPREADIEAWMASVTRSESDGRQVLLDEHHRKGISPYEPPPLGRG